MDRTRIRDFVVESSLGAGGMATVHLARREGTGEQAALKLMHPHLAKDEAFVKRFLREIAASAELSHENIVRVLECGQEGGTYFIASEFVDSGTLEELIRCNDRLPAAVAAEIARQLLAGLEEAHARGIVHRDIKPANLLLSSAGLVKIADFGIAKVEAATQLTQTGGVLGTPAYMSPEQALGKPFDLRTDLFSAGVALYEMLTGTNPFIADSPAATMVRIAKVAPPMLLELAPATPPEVAEVAEALLEKDPQRRPATAAQARSALDAWFASQGIKGKTALAAYLRDAATTTKKANEHLANRCVEKARSLLASGGSLPRAVLELHRALQGVPEHAGAVELMKQLQSRTALYFGPAKNPKILELEKALDGATNPAGVLTQLSSLYKLEGNLFKATVCLRRAVRLRPNDGYLMGQLELLTGEKGSAPTLAFPPIPLTQPAPGHTAALAPAAATPSGFADTQLRAPVPADDGELHTGQTGMTRPRPKTEVLPPSVPLVDPIPLPPPSRLDLLRPLWDAGGKYLVIGLLVVGGMVFFVRRASRTIDHLTEEEAKAHEVANKAIEKRARDLLAPALREQQASWARRYGDPLDEAMESALELVKRGKHAEAAAAFAVIAAQAQDRPIGAAAQLGRASALYSAGSYDGAVAELDAWLAKNASAADAPEARTLRVEALYRAQRFSDCVDAATPLIEAGEAPDHANRLRLARARAALESGQRQMARNDAKYLIDHAASSDPSFTSAVEILAAFGEAPPRQAGPND
ncbi:MAG TPA: serine/threonine-protein kinase [Myxococcales bacterium]|jgi:predicted negative regulator of RcsB-dependent stress response